MPLTINRHDLREVLVRQSEMSRDAYTLCVVLGNSKRESDAAYERMEWCLAELDAFEATKDTTNAD